MKTYHDRRAYSPRAAALILGIMIFISSQSLFSMAREEAFETDSSFTVTDMRGREITVPGEINRVIALDAGALRLLSYLDATDKVIAVEDAGHGREITDYGFFSLATYRIAFPELRELPSIGNKENHEGIIAAAPELIISSTVDSGQLDQLQDVLGIPVFAVNVDVELFDSELFYSQLTTLGQVLGRQDRAKELISGIDAVLADLEARASRASGAKRTYAGGMMFFGPADILRTTGDYLPFDFIGAENVMPTSPVGNGQPYMTSVEDLISAAPDYVFIDGANINLSRSGFETNRKVLEEQVPAFMNQQVYSTLVYKYYGTNWENQLINAYFVGKVLYPDLYGDISVERKGEEIWQLFFGRPLTYDQVVQAQKGGPEKVDWFN